MKHVLPGASRRIALALLVLASGCAAKWVAPPDPPPAFDAGSEAARPNTPPPNTPPPSTPPPSTPPKPVAEAAPPSGTENAPHAAAPGVKQAGDNPASDKPPADQSTDKENPPLGWIAGQPLEAEELLLEWGDLASRELYLVLDKLVAARLALAEAGRLGIRLAPEEVETRYAAEREKLAQKVARDGKGKALEEFIEDELGFEPARYLDRVRRGTIRQMLAERAVRACSLGAESVALRLIVVKTDEDLEKVRAALAEGRDFGDVARELSVDDTKANGGLVPFVVAQERSPLARLAFQTPVGEVAGPLPIADHQFWIRIEERRQALEGDWDVLEQPVEASLKRFAVADAEFVHWKLLMEGRYPIDLGPLWSLIGASR